MEIKDTSKNSSDSPVWQCLPFEFSDPFAVPDGGYLTAEGEFIWVPSHEDGGSHEFTVRVTDSGETANWSETTFTIEVNAR